MHAMPRVLGWPYPRRSNRPQLRRTKNSGSQAPTESVLPWTRADTVVLGAYVQAAFDTLPEDYRQAIELRCFAGKSLAETASIMQRSPRAIQGLVDRGRKKMRAALGSLSLYE